MNPGYNISYMLWVLKGSNSLDHLSYYSKHVLKMTDDEMTLRGAYGPRLLNWIGADQLQESLEANKDIDKVEDFSKPVGINQLERSYNDLKLGLSSTCCVIFNPSIDFDDTKYVPDLISFGFNVGTPKCLRLTAIYNQLPKSKINLQADMFLLHIIAQCFCSLLDKERLLKIICFDDTVLNGSIVEEYDKYEITNKTPESLWKDIHLVCDCDKNIMNIIKKESINNVTVDIIGLVDDLIKRLEPIECQFWRDCAFILIASALKRYGKDKYDDYIGKSVLCNIHSEILKLQFKEWSDKKDGKTN